MSVETPTVGEDEARKDYSDADRKAMAKSGHAMPDGSYPIANAEDLHNAIHAVGRGGSSHDAIRKHIISRAHALGMSDAIPDNWNSDGSLKQSNSRRRTKQRHRAQPLQPEVRHFAAHDLEIRSSNDSDEIVITGSPIVYGTPYAVTDMFGEFEERMSPGVAADALERGADVRFLFNHDGMPLARSTSGTLTLRDGARSLDFEARLDARQQLANDLAIAIERGDVSQMSCGFIVARDEWDDAMESRTIHQFADLLDVSAVTYPASPTTTIQIAQRMAEHMSPVSAARIDRMYRDLRAGRVFSKANQDKLVGVVGDLHDILSKAGVDMTAVGEDTDVEGVTPTEVPTPLPDGTEEGEPILMAQPTERSVDASDLIARFKRSEARRALLKAA